MGYRVTNLDHLLNNGDKQDGGIKSVERLNVGLGKTLHEDPTLALKHRNVLNFLNNRGLGMIANVQAEKEFYQTKTSHKTEESSFNLSLPYSYDSCEVSYIKGDGESLLGVWRLDSGSEKEMFVKGKIFKMNNRYCATYEPCGNVVDMCQVSTDLIDCNYSALGRSDSVSVHVYDIRLNNLPALNCCCFIPGDDAVMLGCFGFILTIRRGHLHYYQTGIREIRTLSHHEPSKVTLVGLHTGEILTMDHRMDEQGAYSIIKVSDKAINDSVFLNEQEVIVTDVEGKLVKVDLRSKDISTYFFGHKHSATKRPFSVANNMLCATGVDNVVRIWHVSGGLPIHAHKSDSMHEVRGWLNSDANKTYLNYFERDNKIVFTI